MQDSSQQLGEITNPTFSASPVLPVPEVSTQPSNTSYYQQENSEQNSNAFSTSKIIILILLGLLLIILSIGVYGSYNYLSPRLKLASALHALVHADSFRVNIEMLLKDDVLIKINSENQANAAFLQQREIVFHTPLENQKEVTFTDTTIFNQTQSYMKLSHSNMNQMYNYLLTIHPEFQEHQTFKELESLLHGDSWFYQAQNALETPSVDSTTITKPQILLALIGFSLEEYDVYSDTDGTNFTKFSMRPNLIAAELLAGAITRTQLDLTLAQAEELGNILSKNEYLTKVQVDFLIENQGNNLTTINISFPQDLIATFENYSQPSSEPTSIGSVLQSPVSLVGWLEKEATRPQLSLHFSDLNTVVPRVVPAKVVGTAEEQDAYEILGFIFYSFSDPEFIRNALGPDNTYVTSTHETKLLFHQGKYAEGLEKARQALVHATTDEHRAFANYWIGLHSHKLGNNQEAELRLLTALSLKSEYAAPYVTLGSIYLEKNNYQKLREYSQTCIGIDPSYAWCHNNLGIALVMLDQKAAGISAIEKAISLDPNNFGFNDNLKRAKESR